MPITKLGEFVLFFYVCPNLDIALKCMLLALGAKWGDIYICIMYIYVLYTPITKHGFSQILASKVS